MDHWPHTEKMSPLVAHRVWLGLFFILAMVLLLDIIGVRLANIHLDADFWKTPLEAFATFELMALAVISPTLAPAFKKHIAAKNLLTRISMAIHAFSYLLLFTLLVVLLSYFLTATIKAPLIDHQLARLDHLIGFDWPGIFDWITRQKKLETLLQLAYKCTTIQTGVIVILTALLAPRGHLAEFVFLFVSSILIVLVIACFFPAEGAFYYYGKQDFPGAKDISDFLALRTGSISKINIFHLQGLIAFPSFHACMAIMFCYAVRSSRILTVLALPLNGVVLFSAIYWGGHYLTDLLAATLLMLILIGYSRSIRFYPAD
jgi:membrane-associated phospholipid phosphatase